MIRFHGVVGKSFSYTPSDGDMSGIITNRMANALVYMSLCTRHDRMIVLAIQAAFDDKPQCIVAYRTRCKGARTSHSTIVSVDELKSVKRWSRSLGTSPRHEKDRFVQPCDHQASESSWTFGFEYASVPLLRHIPPHSFVLGAPAASRRHLTHAGPYPPCRSAETARTQRPWYVPAFFPETDSSFLGSRDQIVLSKNHSPWRRLHVFHP